MTAPLPADGLSTDPWWWERTPRPDLPAQDLPGAVDVAVVGSGYTGLCAALQTARGGRSTVVFDANDAGWGCSSRNGGQISTSVKPGYAELSRRHGPEAARAILAEGCESLAWIGPFLREEGIACDFAVCGRFHAAHSPRHYEALAREVAARPEGLDPPAHMVPRAEQRRELGTDAYHGGAVFETHAALDPGRFHAGLLRRAMEAGAVVAPHCPVLALDRDGGAFEVATPRGRIRARDVVVATNGYTGPLTPWLRRRTIPIGSYMIATEALPAELMARLMPRGRIVSDTRKVVYYYRPSPDGRRVLFGGRVTAGEADPRRAGALLRRDMAAIFPELSDARVTHSWMGFVAYTFDTLPHIGERDGLHYAMGYCGSGVAMAARLGTRLGRRVLGLSGGRSGLDAAPFRTRPFYAGVPWFLSAAVAWHRWRDGAAARAR